jgi:hypothetical protein
MRTILRLATAAALLHLLACHNQSTEDDRGQAMHGKAPDSLAVPPQPVIATSAGPVASVPAADLARTAPPGPPNHDGPSVCHVSVGNLLPEGRILATQNTGNVGIRSGKAVVYAYDAKHAQIARVEVSLLAAADGGTMPVLQPRDGVRTMVPMAPAVARDPNDWLIPVLVHVDFVDGATWDAPADRAPARRAFAEAERGRAVN